MIRKFLKNKKGVTLLEGLIALLLLALVATGTFGVLLSASRKSTSPDVREEMALAVEKVHHLLQAYALAENTGSLNQSSFYGVGICGDTNPLNDFPSEHIINSCLPPICERSNSSFKYYVSVASLHQPAGQSDASLVLPGYDKLGGDPNPNNLQNKSTLESVTRKPTYRIKFDITCNGYTL